MMEHDARKRTGRSTISEAGYSLLEMMVSSLVFVLVVGGMLSLLTGLGDAYRDQQELTGAQQSARVALQQMQQDAQLAGVGLAWLLPPLPLIVPQPDGGVEIRHNQGQLLAGMMADMAAPNSAIVVDNAAGFLPGMEVVVYDATGAIETLILTGVDAGNNRLLHGGLSKAYLTADGTAVARLRKFVYSVQPNGGAFELLRSADGGAPQIIARNVRAINIRYFDDANPPQQFAPATVGDQLRIQLIEISIEVETENNQLNTTMKRSVTLTTRVTPRAMALS